MDVAVSTVTLVCRASFDGVDCHLQRLDSGGRFCSWSIHLASLRVLRAIVTDKTQTYNTSAQPNLFSVLTTNAQSTTHRILTCNHDKAAHINKKKVSCRRETAGRSLFYWNWYHTVFHKKNQDPFASLVYFFTLLKLNNNNNNNHHHHLYNTAVRTLRPHADTQDHK